MGSLYGLLRFIRPIISSFDPCLQALEDVDSAATTVTSERGDVANADLLGLVRVRGGALRDALGAGAALLQDVTAAKLAVKGALRVGGVALHGHTVRGGNERGSSSSENNESLDHVERSVGEVCCAMTTAILYPSSGFFDFFLSTRSSARQKEEPERTVMGLAQISPAQEEWFIMQRNEISHLSMIGLHRHVLGHFHTVKVAF